MRNRWLIVVVVASLCLNVALVGTYVFRRARHGRPRRFPSRGLTSEAREKIRKARDAAMPEFAELMGRVESTDSVLWAEMRREAPDSARVESLCQELGQMHGRMRANVFRQMHRELLLMPAEARAEYLQHMMRMRPGLPLGGRHASGEPRRGMGRHQRRGSRMSEPREGGPPSDEPQSGPPPESGD
jgi:hypothetical protein